MHIHWLQHVEFEDLGNIETWALQKGHKLTQTRLYVDEPLPEIDSFDALVVMGGPMSVNDVDQYPWLSDELAFIASAITAGKPILGVCLGAQLIAKALGGEIKPAPKKEIGWWPIKSEYEIFDGVVPLHWHGEMFSLPQGSLALASTGVTPDQAFLYADNVLGLQFHLEATAFNLKAMKTHCADELNVESLNENKREFIQSGADLQAGEDHMIKNRQVLFGLLDAWLAVDDERSSSRLFSLISRP